jgi:hypothetical protein
VGAGYGRDALGVCARLIYKPWFYIPLEMPKTRWSSLAVEDVPPTFTGSGGPGPIGQPEWEPSLSIEPEFAPQRCLSLRAPLTGAFDWSASAEFNSALDDLLLLRDNFQVRGFTDDVQRHTFVERGTKKYGVDEYLRYRLAFFGSTYNYNTCFDQARAELDDANGRLRELIEPPKNSKANNHWRTNHPRWKEAQNIFYTWIRKAYENDLGPGTDIPALINARESPQLTAALKRVEKTYGHSVPPNGFNPRPMKLSEFYRLGTISEHARGFAIDVDAPHNAQFTAKTWDGISRFTGKQLPEAQRKALWQSSPDGLHRELVDISAMFMSKLQGLLSRGATLEALWRTDADLHTFDNVATLRRWSTGFFSLPLDLVKAFHQEKFKWGATFRSPDLHHFEL